jgi:hypothetical protein
MPAEVVAVAAVAVADADASLGFVHAVGRQVEVVA